MPSRIAPAARSRSTTAASYGGIQPARIREPAVVGTPAVTRLSLSVIGTPASGPSGSPAARLRVELGGGGARARGVEGEERADLAVQAGDPLDRRLDERGGGDLTGGDAARRLGDRPERGRRGHGRAR